MLHAGASLPAARGVGEMAVVETLPAVVVALFSLLTHLGDPATLMVVVTLGYLLAARVDVVPTRLAAVFALGMGALALTVALKGTFALPRPPGATVDGYGFPSGHAIGATVVYGGLAALLPARNRDHRVALVAAAAVLVGVVALSRVVIGVHYVVDVVVGTVVGLTFLAVALRVGPGVRPETVSVAAVGRVFAVAVAVGLFALVGAGGREAAAAVGAAVGGWGAWRLVGSAVARDALSRSETGVVVLSLVPLAVGVGVVPAADLPLVVTAVAMAVLVGSVVALPRLAASVTD